MKARKPKARTSKRRAIARTPRPVTDRRVVEVLAGLADVQAYVREERGGRRNAIHEAEGPIDHFMAHGIVDAIDSFGHWPEGAIRSIVTAYATHAPAKELAELVEFARREKSFYAEMRAERTTAAEDEIAEARTQARRLMVEKWASLGPALLLHEPHRFDELLDLADKFVKVHGDKPFVTVAAATAGAEGGGVMSAQTWAELGTILRIREPARYQLVETLIAAIIAGEETMLVRCVEICRCLEARSPSVIESLVELGEGFAYTVGHDADREVA